MPIRPWLSALAACVLLSSPLAAGDYSHVLEAVKRTWPGRTTGVAFCSLEANQLALLDLVDTAKEQGLSLAIIDLKGAKDSEKTIRTGLGRQPQPDFVLVIDEDPQVGTAGPLLGKLVARALSLKVPAVGLRAGDLDKGAALAVGSEPGAKVFANRKVLRQLNLAVPEGAEDPTEARDKR